MTPFERAMAAGLASLLRAGVPARGLRFTVRELVVQRIERGPLGAREVGDAVEAAVRAGCRLVRERQAPAELVDTVCLATLEAVRGHGGESARWLTVAVRAATSVLDELAGGRAEELAWRRLAQRLAGPSQDHAGGRPGTQRTRSTRRRRRWALPTSSGCSS